MSGKDPWCGAELLGRIDDETAQRIMESTFRRLQPVFLVLDTSGSMTGPRIDMLNQSVKELITFLSDIQGKYSNDTIKIAVLEYNSGYRWVTPGLVPVQEMIWDNLHAGGMTDLGATLTELEYQLSRKAMLKSDTGCRPPVIIFTTDGISTDECEKSLERLWKNNWYKSAVKIAVGIGDAFDKEFLEKLVGNQEAVLIAHDASEILSVFENIISMLFCMPVLMGDFMPQDENSITDSINPIAYPDRVNDAYGRAKCKMLKKIRKSIADANGIPYEITECYSEGHCNGACPACDSEAAELSRMLTEMAAAGKTIQMPGMETSALDEYLPEDDLWEAPRPVNDDEIFELDGWFNVDW